MSDETAAYLLIGGQELANFSRMRACHMFVSTVDVAVGGCPGYDDILVWLKPSAEPALSVRAETWVMEDFNANVYPLVCEYRDAHAAHDRETRHCKDEQWLKAAKHNVAGDSWWRLLLEASPQSDGTTGEARQRTLGLLMKALYEFTARNNAQPEDY